MGAEAVTSRRAVGEGTLVGPVGLCETGARQPTLGAQQEARPGSKQQTSLLCYLFCWLIVTERPEPWGLLDQLLKNQPLDADS